MITVADGVARLARVAVGMLDGVLLSSGRADRVRTLRLREDPRCTLFVFAGDWQWLTLESTVILREGEEAMALQVPLPRQIQDRPTGPLSWFEGDIEEAELLASMRADRRPVDALIDAGRARDDCTGSALPPARDHSRASWLNDRLGPGVALVLLLWASALGDERIWPGDQLGHRSRARGIV